MIRCETPASIVNGILHSNRNSTIFGTVIEYSCNPGYKLIGSKEIKCMSSGQYDNVPPICQGIINLLHQ